MSERTELRAFSVSAIASTPGKVGYRTRLVSAQNEAEAIGIGMKAFEAGEPQASFSAPSALEITAERLADLGVIFGPAPTVEQAAGWQPIETAPKDGTPILTYSTGCDETESRLVMWWEDKKAERSGFGWVAYEVSHCLMPDFWMPLPPPPAGGSHE